MIKRTLFLVNPCVCTLRNSQFILVNKESGEERSVPIEDVGYVIVENGRVSMSVPLMNALVKNNAVVAFCDERHMPSSLLLSMASNHVQSEVFRYQLEAGLPLKKNLWKQIVEAKIRNQAALLTSLGLDGDVLKPYWLNVKSGDVDNREGTAANRYWDILFGKDFIRDRHGKDYNSLLNYGYAILRAATCRAIVGSGLLPLVGLFHKNRYNAFPLADDLMEPYRPYIDRIVVGCINDGIIDLQLEAKQRLLGSLTNDCQFDDMKRPLSIGLSLTTGSLVRCLRGEIKQLSLPGN